MRDFQNSVEFAELCGIHAGDGWMSSLTYEIGYGTSPEEEAYFWEVYNLYLHIFCPQHVRVLRRLALEFRFQSKKAQYILMAVGFPRGKKLDKLHVPQFILGEKDKMKAFLRGLIDTDGHVYWRRSCNHYYLLICWITTSHQLSADIIHMLTVLGYTCHVQEINGRYKDGIVRRALYKICLIRKSDISQYLNEIGFRNFRRWQQVAGRFDELPRYAVSKSVFYQINKWARPDSNRGPSPCEGDVCSLKK